MLDVGAGTGRVALDLLPQGHGVTALDSDAELLAELATPRRRSRARDRRSPTRAHFELGRRFALCIVPMQTIQLLGGRDGRLAFLRCARRHLDRGGRARDRDRRDARAATSSRTESRAAARHLRARRGRLLEPADRGPARRATGSCSSAGARRSPPTGERSVVDERDPARPGHAPPARNARRRAAGLP